jgi:hypothetical protein
VHDDAAADAFALGFEQFLGVKRMRAQRARRAAQNLVRGEGFLRGWGWFLGVPGVLPVWASSMSSGWVVGVVVVLLSVVVVVGWYQVMGTPGPVGL